MGREISLIAFLDEVVSRNISMEHRLQKGWQPKTKKRPDTPAR